LAFVLKRMSSNQFAKSIDEIIRIDPTKAFELMVDELQAIIDRPPLPADHPNAALRQLEKKAAQAMMDEVQARLQRAVPLALKRVQEIIDLRPLPPDDPHAASLRDLKRSARTTLLYWNAHYGPGGLFEELGTKDR
jgi:hypothetical protein